MATQYQLRIYQVKPGAMEDWISEWRERIVPLRRQMGFRVPAAWTIRDEDRFVWFLAYDGPDDYATADRRYYASPERASLDPDPTRHLAQMESWLMDLVPPRLEPGEG